MSLGADTEPVTTRTGGSGFQVSGGRFTGAGTDLNPDIREEKGYGTPYGNAGIWHDIWTQVPAVNLAYRLFAAVISSMPWDFRYEEQAKADPTILDRTRRAYFDDLEGWDLFIQQKCQAFIYGAQGFEVEERVASDGAIVPSRFLQRMMFSVERIHRVDERFGGITQRIQPFDEGPTVARFIAAWRMLWYVHDQQADHVTGMSMLRQAYGPAKAILNLWRLMLIAFQRNAFKVPVAHLAEEQFEDRVYKDDLREEMKFWSSSELAHLILKLGPDGKTALDLMGGDVVADAFIQALRYFGWEILSNVGGQFLALGATDVGARAVGDTQARIFWKTMGSKVAILTLPVNNMADTLQLGTVRRFVTVNFGERETYPTLFAATPRAETLKSLAEAMKTLKDAGFLHPTVADQMTIRDENFLPQLTEADIARVEESIANINHKPVEGMPPRTPAKDGEPAETD